MAKVFCKVVEQDNGTINFHFSPGEENEQIFNYNPEELSPAIQRRLMILGLTNKLRDSYASSKGVIGEAVEKLQGVWDNLKHDLWTASRASGPAKPKTLELAQAIANLRGLEVEAVQSVIDAAEPDQIKAWKANPEVKAEIQSIRAAAARARLEASEENPVLDFPELGKRKKGS